MKRAIDVLRNRDAAGVYLLPGHVPVADIAKVCQEVGYAFFLVPGEEIRTKADLLASIARILQFPPYFGANWDALEDCLTDLSWIEADSFVIVCNSVGLFARHYPDEFGTLLDIFKDASEFWKSRGAGFFALLSGVDEEESGLPLLG